MSAPDDFAHNLIRAFYERWDRLESEKDAISGDLKELFAEAKGQGFDTKVLRKLFRDQKADAGERQEFEALYDLYAAALNGPLARDARDAREDDEEFDPETGEIKPVGNGADSAETAVQVATFGATPSANKPEAPTPRPEAPVNPVAHVENARGAKTSEQEPSEPEGSGEMHGRCEPISPPIPPPAEGNTPTSAGHGDESATHAAALVVATNVVELRKPKAPTFNDPAHRDCLEPGRCGGFSNLGLCDRCREAAESGQVA